MTKATYILSHETSYFLAGTTAGLKIPFSPIVLVKFVDYKFAENVAVTIGSSAIYRIIISGRLDTVMTSRTGHFP
jgi:hypothetical protein